MSRCYQWLLLGSVLLAGAAQAADKLSYGAELEGFDYPWPVQQFEFNSQRNQLHMAYMDVQADTPNGHTAVLLHGKNFCAATWESTVKVLNTAGYRVIVPDQIGFCKSSKPEAYQSAILNLRPYS